MNIMNIMELIDRPERLSKEDLEFFLLLAIEVMKK